MVDIWALGVLLFFMLVGVTPFKGETVSDMKVMIMEGKFQLPEYVSKNAGDLIRGMLQPEIEKRVDIDFLKKNFWLRDCRFAKSYMSIKADVRAELEEEKTVCNDKVGGMRSWPRNVFGHEEEKIAFLRFQMKSTVLL